MGFEQLAALRDQLAKQAAEERRRQGKPEPRANPDEGKAGDKQEAKGHPAKPNGKSGAPRPHRGNTNRPGEGRPNKPGEARGNRPQRRAEKPQEPPRDPLLVAIGRLQKHFPKTFPKRPDPRVPLKLGIIDDLYAHAGKLHLSEEEIKQAVATWCSAQRYWACLVKDAARLDLNGEPSGTVTPAEAAHASFLARKQRKKAQEEKAAAAKKAAPAQPDEAESPAPSAAEPQAVQPAADATPASAPEQQEQPEQPEQSEQSEQREPTAPATENIEPPQQA